MKLLKPILLALASIAVAISSHSQSLSAEQEAKLNSLPPALKQQALEQLRKTQGSQNNLSEKPVEQPQVVTPKNTSSNDQRIVAEFQQSTDLGTTDESSNTKIVTSKLEQFGYDLFAGTPSTFAPATEIPIPVDYVIGPGDQVRIQLFGKESNSYDLYVTREGILQVPQLGPLSVAGQTFQELKQNISRRVVDQMIGVESFVTLGELRSIRVFILGDVTRPGSYTVSSLSTMTNALFVSGGIKPIGTLRNIELKRAGTVVATLDLYDLLLRGDTSKDVGLKPGDVIFVPPVGQLVGIGGEVRRPAIYELQGDEAVESVITMAGGLTPQAYPSISQIERISSKGLKELLDINLSEGSGLQTKTKDGDTIRIYSTLDRIENLVRLEGLVERPGDYQWHESIRISDILTSIEDLQPNADLRYALVVSQDNTSGQWSTRSFSIESIFLGNLEQHDLYLSPRDRIIIFDDTKENRDSLESIVSRLKSQGTSEEPQKIVSLSGSVRHPGSYPLDENMRISDLIRAGGGFTQDAYTLEAELLRFTDNNKTQRSSLLLPISLNEIESRSSADIKLQPFDQITIRRIPEWTEEEVITISGEVRFPGNYTIERGDTLSQIITRAGGLTELAHPESAVFIRESLRQLESQNLDKLRQRLRAEIAATSLQRDEYSVDSLDTAQTLLDQLENAKAAGRLVIDLPNILQGYEDVALTGGDEISIPQAPQAVTIIGSVNYPTSHLYQNGLGQDDYIALSGGLMKNADKRQIYVVRSNGRVEIDRRSRFFPKGGLSIQPGDTLVIPLDVDRIAPLKLWASTSQIFYQIALGAAAVNSF